MQTRPDAVKFRGKPLALVGPQLKAGDQAPDFACLSQALEIVTLATTPAGKVRFFSVVPSLDTPVCSAMTKKFEQFGFGRVCNIPAAATREEAALLREVAHQVAWHDSVNANGSVTPGIMEKMFENVLDEFSLTS